MSTIAAIVPSITSCKRVAEAAAVPLGFAAASLVVRAMLDLFL